MKGQVIQAPKFGRLAQEINQETIASQPFLFSIGTLENDDLSSTQSSQQLPKSLKPVKLSENFKKHQTSFRNVLRKIGISEKNILSKNPLKNIRSRSPETSFEDGKGLPFKRRARSASPPRESLKVFPRKDYLKYPANSPVVANRHAQQNLQWKDVDFKQFKEEDDDLRAIKEEYCRLLEQVPSINGDSDDSEEYWEDLIKGEGLDSLSKYFMRGF